MSDLPNVPPLEITRSHGDSSALTIPLYDPDTGARYGTPPAGPLLWTLKESSDDPDPAALIQKLSNVGGITLADPAIVTLVADDAAAIVPRKTYLWDILDTAANRTVATGNLWTAQRLSLTGALAVPTYTTDPATYEAALAAAVTAAEAARDAALAAQAAAETARDLAANSATSAAAAQAAAEAARDAALAAQAAAEAARAAAQTAQAAAAASATAADASAAAASVSQDAALASEAAAAASAAAAAASAAAALTSATNAATSATAADTARIAAQAAQTAAETAAAAAAASATAAGTSATNAANSATAAATSATNAAASAAAAAASAASIDAKRNALANAPGILSDGRYIPFQIPNSPAWAIGTDNFTLYAKLSLATYAPTATQVLLDWVASNLGVRLSLLTTGVLRLQFGNGANLTTYQFDSTANLTGYSAYAPLHLAVSCTRAGNAVFYVNDIQLGNTVSIAAASAQSLTSTSALRLLSDGTTHYIGTILGGFSPLYNGALSATQVANIFINGGRPTRDVRWGTQDLWGTGRLGSVGANDGPAIIPGFDNTSFSIQAGARTGGAGSYFARTSTGGNAAFEMRAPAGSTITVSFWAKAATNGSGGWRCVPANQDIGIGNVAAGTGSGEALAATTAWQQFNKTFNPTEDVGSLLFTGMSVYGGAFDLDDISIKVATGALFYFELDEGIGCQAHTHTQHGLDATVGVGSTGGVSDGKWLSARREGYVRNTLSWTGTHEGKSLIGQRALPNGAVITLATTKATAASSGSGQTLGSSSSSTRFVVLNTFSAGVKKVLTITNQLPDANSSSYNDIVLDPDTAAFTGAVAVEVHYRVTEGIT